MGIFYMENVLLKQAQVDVANILVPARIKWLIFFETDTKEDPD